MSQTIIRISKDPANPYVMIDKRVAEDPSLSWKAKGLMAYLLSRPDNWKVLVSDLVNRSADGEHAVRAGLAELERAGYIVRVRVHDPETGRFDGWQMTVFEQPIPEDQRSDPEERRHSQDDDAVQQPPYGGFPHMGNPHVENRQHTNTECTNTDVVEAGRAKNTASPPDPVLEILRLYEQEIGGTLTAMILDDITDLVTSECQDLERWRAAFQASIGARNRWKYVKAVILHPESKPPAEVNRGPNPNRDPHRRPGSRPSGARAVTIPDSAEIERLNLEAEQRLRERAPA